MLADGEDPGTFCRLHRKGSACSSKACVCWCWQEEQEHRVLAERQGTDRGQEREGATREMASGTVSQSMSH